MDASNALAKLPLPTLPKPWRDAQAIGHLAAGKSVREVERDTGISKSTVHNVAKNHADYLEEEKRRFQDKVLGHLRTVLPARAVAASDPENRNGTTSAYWLTDILGWTGKGGGVNVHVGDTYVNQLVLPPADADQETLAKLADARERFGLA